MLMGRFARIDRIVLVACLCALTLLGQAEPAHAQADNSYRLGAGDRIRVTVFGHEDLSGEFELDGTGRVSLPLIRTVEAKGLTLSELEQAITNRLQPDFLKDPSVSVDVLNYRPFYIIGEVNEPGSYPYVNGMTVWNAVAMAGGFSYRAKKSEVEIKRGGDTAQTDWQEANPDTIVFPGDVIRVPERFF